MYKDLGVPSSNLKTNYATGKNTSATLTDFVGAGHSFPTDNYGNPCGTTESPYITNCGFDGAGAALQWIYGSLKPRKSPVASNVCYLFES